MSTADVVAPVPGPPASQDPTVGHTDISPKSSPDGRTTGEDTIAPAEQQPGIDMTLKDSLKSNVTFDDPTDPKQDTNTKGTARVTEYRSVDVTEKDSGRGDEAPVIDIVKQSKLKDSELSESQEFPHSRPMTETSARDGIRTTIDNGREKKEIVSETDRDIKSPFSVTIERKPLHTAQTRSHSDYFSKTPSTSRYTYIAASINQFMGFPPDWGNKNEYYRHHYNARVGRARRPPKLVRLATVTMSPKTRVHLAETKPVPRGPSLYYEEPKKPSKVITWDEAHDARPPLRVDMEGPGPTFYSPRNKPLNETNAPAWSFGTKCFSEKAGGSRTSWEKTWFQGPSVWTNKTDFHSDSAWPTPIHYKARPMLGPRQRTMQEAPSFSIGVRKEMTLNKPGSDKEPSPVDYDKDTADKLVLKQAPSFTHQMRRSGTVIWGSKEKSPGPGSYSPKYSYNKPHGPSFSIRNMRREKSHVLGPFSTF